jgi:phosphotransferase system HPr (HPr) family protein
MYEKSINKSSKLKFHGRPASEISRLSNDFKCDILLKIGDQTINAKSVTRIMLDGNIDNSTEITIIANSENEILAVDSIANLIQADCEVLNINKILLNKLLEVFPADSDFVKHLKNLNKNK